MDSMLCGIREKRENETITETCTMNTDTPFEMATPKSDGERLNGRALDAQVTPELPRTSRVDQVDSILEELAYDESTAPIWEQLSAIGRQAPPSAWEAVPTDLSVRLDEVVYGAGASRA